MHCTSIQCPRVHGQPCAKQQQNWRKSLGGNQHNLGARACIRQVMTGDCTLPNCWFRHFEKINGYPHLRKLSDIQQKAFFMEWERMNRRTQSHISSQVADPSFLHSPPFLVLSAKATVRAPGTPAYPQYAILKKPL